MPILLTPSVSPIFYNNPGYTIIDVEDGETKMVHWRHLQLYQYAVTRLKSFSTIRPQSLFNVRFSDPYSIRYFTNKLQTDANLFGQYMAAKMGYGWLGQTAGSVLYPLSKLFYWPELH